MAGASFARLPSEGVWGYVISLRAIPGAMRQNCWAVGLAITAWRLQRKRNTERASLVADTAGLGSGGDVRVLRRIGSGRAVFCHSAELYALSCGAGAR